MTAEPGRLIGASVRRQEDRRLLSGRGQYVDDVQLSRMLHAAFLRSTQARGLILALDTADAKAAPGVRAVLTADDLHRDLHSAYPLMAGPVPNGPQLRALAEHDVRYVGDPIAIVIADSRYAAEDAIEKIELDIKPLPAVLSAGDGSLSDSPLVHAEMASNVASVTPAADDPELEEIFASAPIVVEQTFTQHRYLCAPMEPRAIIASWEPFADELQVWLSTQAPHEVRRFLARAMEVPEHRIRVQTRDVGGGFGQKMFLSREELAVALASRRLSAAIKWIEDRYENLVAGPSARQDSITVSVAADRDGVLLGMKAHLIEDVGAYPPGGTGSLAPNVRLMLPGPYRVGRLGFSGTAVHTNTPGRAPYRGPWMIETIAREQILDYLARTIGMDPLELRRRNVIQTQELPYRTASGAVYDSISSYATQEQAAELVDYAKFRDEQHRLRYQGRYVGIGVSSYVEPSAMGFGVLGTEAALVRIDPTGSVSVLLGSASHGQGLETTMPQIVAETLGCGIDDVVLVQGDTAAAPYGAGTGGSRSAVLYGNAARNAALELRSKLAAMAAHLWEAAPDDVEIDQGVARVRGTSSPSMSIAELAHVAYLEHGRLPPGMTAGLEVTTRFTSVPITWSNATHICTCEVDVTTGLVTLLRYVVSEDCGNMINPMIVEGQIAGGVIQGVGGCLFEHLPYDDHGNPLASTLMDYLLPASTEVPMLEYGHVETAAPTNPGGFRGMAEGGAIGSPAAVINAVADALAPLGVTITQQPLTPDRLLELIHAAQDT